LLLNTTKAIPGCTFPDRVQDLQEGTAVELHVEHDYVRARMPSVDLRSLGLPHNVHRGVREHCSHPSADGRRIIDQKNFHCVLLSAMVPLCTRHGGKDIGAD
jgi:hypothetical protein